MKNLLIILLSLLCFSASAQAPYTSHTLLNEEMFDVEVLPKYRLTGTGNPEGVVTANPGVVFDRTDSVGRYRKAAGTGNTGWYLEPLFSKELSTNNTYFSVTDFSGLQPITRRTELFRQDADRWGIGSSNIPNTGLRTFLFAGNGTGGIWYFSKTGNTLESHFAVDGTAFGVATDRNIPIEFYVNNTFAARFAATTRNLELNTQLRIPNMTAYSTGTKAYAVQNSSSSGELQYLATIPQSDITGLADTNLKNTYKLDSVTVSNDSLYEWKRGVKTFRYLHTSGGGGGGSTLTFGYGLTGTSYNGGAGVTTTVDTSTVSTKANVVDKLLPYAPLTSAISGVALNGTLFSLTPGYGLIGSAYNGGTARTWDIDTSKLSTKANVVDQLLPYMLKTDTTGQFVKTVGGTTPIASTGGQNPVISIANAAADGTTKGASAYTAADFNASSGVISIDYTNGQAASTTDKGFLTASNWNTFNGKQDAISLTTTGTSGAATFIGNVLNIPQYSGGGGSGTVTSVDLTVPSWLTVTGNPVTTSGTLAVAAATGQTANRFVATPDGSPGAVSLRAIVATDVPTLNQNTTGSAATLTTTRTIWGQNFNGSANVTGTLALGSSDLTLTGSIGATGARSTKGWFTDLEITNAPTVGGVAQPTPSSTTTFTNKRITKRTGTTTSSATPTINPNNVDLYTITAQTVDITSMTTNLTTSGLNAGDELEIWITGTASRAITWGASFAASSIAIPTTTSSTSTLRTTWIWDGSVFVLKSYF